MQEKLEFIVSVIYYFLWAALITANLIIALKIVEVIVKVIAAISDILKKVFDFLNEVVTRKERAKKVCVVNYIYSVKELNKWLKAGADPNKKDSAGATALMWAAYYGGIHQTKLLLEYGANPFVEKDGITALSRAKEMG